MQSLSRGTKTTRRGPVRRWTRQEEQTLLTAVGNFGVGYMMRKTGRTRIAVDQKIFSMFGGGGVSRGTLSVRMVAANTGYTEAQICRAGRALAQRWCRTSTYGKNMITEDQAEALVRWLRHDYWSGVSKTYACVYCGRTQYEHEGLGLCHPCYQVRLVVFTRAGLEFSAAGLAAAVEAVRRTTPPADHDWLDSFAASLEMGCVLTRGTLDRLLREAAAVQKGGG